MCKALTPARPQEGQAAGCKGILANCDATRPRLRQASRVRVVGGKVARKRCNVGFKRAPWRDLYPSGRARKHANKCDPAAQPGSSEAGLTIIYADIAGRWPHQAPWEPRGGGVHEKCCNAAHGWMLNLCLGGSASDIWLLHQGAVPVWALLLQLG